MVCISFAEKLRARYHNTSLEMLRFIYGDLNPIRVEELKTACRSDVSTSLRQWQASLVDLLPSHRISLDVIMTHTVGAMYVQMYMKKQVAW